ncbi:MAG: polyprenyl synthetase family protein [Planctomycetota bacterium]
MTTLCGTDNPVATALEQVIEAFDQETRSDQPCVNRLLERVRTYRGKLLRPQLLLLSADATGGIRDEHIVLGAVVEMVHMATLVHDDVLDEADVRRHGATVNRLAGNEGAVLLGDYLISHAYHLCSSLGSTHASRRIAAATNTVCEGELAQIESRGNFALTEVEYIEIIRRKTAALTSVCCELGAELAQVEPRVVRNMASFGEDLGIAFQIVDDLLDLTATEDEMGKSVGRDADLGKLTLPLIRFLRQADETDRRRLITTLSRDAVGKAGGVRAILEGSGAIDSAMNTAREYVQSALSRIADLPPGHARDRLFATAEFVVQRRR